MDYFKGSKGEPVGESSPAIQVGVKAGPDAEEARWTFLLTVNPMRIPGATGGPVNPIAVF